MKHKEIIYQYKVIFESNGDGYTVTSPQLPGLVTEGNNLKEARIMAKDAIRCYLEVLLKGDFLTKSETKKKEHIQVALK